MNEFKYPEEYDLASFGASPPPSPLRRRTSYYILLGLAGCGISLCLVCVCCIGVSIFAMRQPTILVSIWGTYMANGSYYQFAEMVTCEDSQAKQITRDLTDQHAIFPTFGTPSTLEDKVVVNTQVRIDGEDRPWQATFTVIEGGTLGRCIKEIEVAETTE